MYKLKTILTSIFLLSVTSVSIAQPTLIRVRNTDKTFKYELRFSSAKKVPFIIKDTVLNSVSLEEFNRRLGYMEWYTATNGVPKGYVGIPSKVTSASIQRTELVTAKYRDYGNAGNIFIEMFDSNNKAVTGFPLPFSNKKESEQDVTSSAAEKENQFCSGRPNYAELTKYLNTHKSPCPSRPRGKWCNDQFYRLGQRIEQLHKTKPIEATSLMNEFEEKAKPYIVLEAYTGLQEDKDFNNCLGFIYNVEMAIDKLSY